jgi:hypothetical protein
MAKFKCNLSNGGIRLVYGYKYGFTCVKDVYENLHLFNTTRYNVKDWFPSKKVAQVIIFFSSAGIMCAKGQNDGK